ncbi:response regulator [Roseomonas stagni]|uniref:Response regulator n=1 Tax=Falsiroseomonas algicola TaxID=2716930 RepID=A0A6M1LL39_9PROT|nr:response regulator [Falsiroseomonas algicola]NGM20709.1 response regulator [Falsiroseomonas algicola]
MATPTNTPKFDKKPLFGKRVIIIEDEGILVLLLEDIVVAAGAEVVGSAGAVADALRLIEHERLAGTIDVALVDMKLHQEFAFPVLETLRRRGILTIIITGYEAWHALREYTPAPMISKPIDASHLVATIAQFCE